jgi:hypothetical protein
MMDEETIRTLVTRLSRKPPSGGEVIERAAIVAAGADSAAIFAWIAAHDGQPEALASAGSGSAQRTAQWQRRLFNASALRAASGRPVLSGCSRRLWRPPGRLGHRAPPTRLINLLGNYSELSVVWRSTLDRPHGSAAVGTAECATRKGIG